MAYTYYLFHKPTSKHYYGAKYQKDNCNPNDFWKTYFTSSSLVHNLITDYGFDSFEYSIRKIFNTAEDAIKWESKFLKKVNAQNNPSWLNRHNGSNGFIGPHILTEETKQLISSKIKGIKRSEETKQKIREKAFEREKIKRESGWKMPLDSIKKSKKTIQERIKSGEINPYSEERNKKMATSKKGTKRHYLPNGSFIYLKPQADQ